MPAWVKAVVQLQKLSGITADTVDNDFYFLCDGVTEISAAQADGIRDSLSDFYNLAKVVGHGEIKNFISPAVSRVADACSIKFYSVTEFPTFPIVWGSPKQVRSWTLLAADTATNPMPNEVACVLTYHSDLTNIPETASNPTPPPATIRPAARRRGRLYFGPLVTQAVSSQAPTNEPFPSATLVEALVDAGAWLQGDLPAGVSWMQLSQAATALLEVTGGWVDNAFDSQRRRGNDATDRTTFVA